MRTGPLFHESHIACAMKWHSNRSGLVLVVLAAAPLGCSRGSGVGARPPAVDSRAWSWAAAAPGVNIYIAYPEAPHEPGMQSAWVDRRYFSNPAGVNADVIELQHFDCRDDRNRGSSTRREDGSSQPARALTPGEQVLRTICEHGGAP
jgi:hypothetical protein